MEEKMEGQILFSKDHIWLMLDGDRARLGITGYAQEQLGTVMFLNLPEIGEQLEIGRRFGDVESIKNVSDLISPVDGRVTLVNEGLLDGLDQIHTGPYQSWFIEAKVDKVLDGLLDEAAYLGYKDGL